MMYVCDMFVFFKQKTAYEMRISDWSSDVCSSDLLTPVQAAALFKAAGFPIGADKHPVNRCGQQADPRVLFDDMNDDGRAEAIFIDQEIGRASCRERVCQYV